MPLNIVIRPNHVFDGQIEHVALRNPRKVESPMYGGQIREECPAYLRHVDCRVSNHCRVDVDPPAINDEGYNAVTYIRSSRVQDGEPIGIDQHLRHAAVVDQADTCHAVPDS